MGEVEREPQRLTRRKSRAAALSIASNTTLILVEMGVGILTGSMAIVAGALHSFLDLMASVITYLGVRIGARPADYEHPFGHGKAEAISASIEGGLIFLGAALIIVEAVRRFIPGVELEFLEAGIGVMFFSMLVNIGMSRYLFRVARETESAALEADAWHLTADLLTSLGVVVGLGIIRLTGLTQLDSVLAIAVALFIIRAAWGVTRRAWSGLLDERLPAAEEAAIGASILEHGRELVGFHQLRTRRSGNIRYIDLHLVMKKDTTLEQAHKLCDHLEGDIKSKLPTAVVTIHCEPPEEG